MPPPLRLALVALVFSGALAGAQAATRYDEAVDGDLSNDGLSPTKLSFSSGANQVVGTTGRGANGIDRDYFSFTVAAGQRLAGIEVLAGTNTIGPVSFIGIESGGQVTLPTSATTAAGLLGWWHYGSGDVGTDILPAMAVASNGSSGFTTPLGAGTYSMWIQDFGAGAVDYAFQFDVAAVPEPEAWALMAGGLGLLVLRRFRPRPGRS